MNRISFLNRGYAFKGLLAVIPVFQNLKIHVKEEDRFINQVFLLNS